MILDDVPRVSAASEPSNRSAPRNASAFAQSIVSATPGSLARSISRRRRTAVATSRASASLTCGARTRTICTSRSRSGWSIQWYRQRRFNASCSSRVRFDVTITAGGVSAATLPIRLPSPRTPTAPPTGTLRTRRRPGPTRRRAARPWSPRGSQLGAAVPQGSRARTDPVRVSRRRRRPSHGRRSAGASSSTRRAPASVDALVALQPDQPWAQQRRENLCDLGLADARLALQQERLVQRERQVDRRREAAVGQVRPAMRPRPLKLVDRRQSPTISRSLPEASRMTTRSRSRRRCSTDRLTQRSERGVSDASARSNCDSTSAPLACAAPVVAERNASPSRVSPIARSVCSTATRVRSSGAVRPTVRRARSASSTRASSVPGAADGVEHLLGQAITNGRGGRVRLLESRRRTPTAAHDQERHDRRDRAEAPAPTRWRKCPSRRPRRPDSRSALRSGSLWVLRSVASWGLRSVASWGLRSGPSLELRSGP